MSPTERLATPNVIDTRDPASISKSHPENKEKPGTVIGDGPATDSFNYTIPAGTRFTDLDTALRFFRDYGGVGTQAETATLPDQQGLSAAIRWAVTVGIPAAAERAASDPVQEARLRDALMYQLHEAALTLGQVIDGNGNREKAIGLQQEISRYHLSDPKDKAIQAYAASLEPRGSDLELLQRLKNLIRPSEHLLEDFAALVNGGDPAYATYRHNPNENEGRPYFFNALWHNHTKRSPGETVEEVVVIPKTRADALLTMAGFPLTKPQQDYDTEADKMHDLADRAVVDNLKFTIQTMVETLAHRHKVEIPSVAQALDTLFAFHFGQDRSRHMLVFDVQQAVETILRDAKDASSAEPGEFLLLTSESLKKVLLDNLTVLAAASRQQTRTEGQMAAAIAQDPDAWAFPLWTPEDSVLAVKQGWDIFDASGSDDGRWQLQAQVEPPEHVGLTPEEMEKYPIFADDGLAAEHVRTQARRGDALAQKAIDFLNAVGSQDVAKFDLRTGLMPDDYREKLGLPRLAAKEIQKPEIESAG